MKNAKMRPTAHTFLPFQLTNYIKWNLTCLFYPDLSLCLYLCLDLDLYPDLCLDLAPSLCERRVPSASVHHLPANVKWSKRNSLFHSCFIISLFSCSELANFFLISSFFWSRKAFGMPEGLAWAESNKSQSSPIKMRAFLPFRNPVNMIWIFFGSGCCQQQKKRL